MSYNTIFFDLDDTLYPPTTGLWDLIGERIDLFIQNKVGVPPEETIPLRKRLFETYGTTLRGLVSEFGIDEEEYLSFVHDVPVDQILKPDPILRSLLLSIAYRKIIFTNADRFYTRRVIHALGLDGCFSQIIDILDILPDCKPQETAFVKAMSLAGLASPENIILIDDTPKNLETASLMGFFTILVGNKSPVGRIDRQIPVIQDFLLALPDGNLRNP
jgi:putative hydrolase of the HAD superfamily